MEDKINANDWIKYSLEPFLFLKIDNSLYIFVDFNDNALIVVEIKYFLSDFLTSSQSSLISLFSW